MLLHFSLLRFPESGLELQISIQEKKNKNEILSCATIEIVVEAKHE